MLFLLSLSNMFDNPTKKNKIAAQHRENTIPAGRSYMISDLLFKNIRLFNPAVLFTLRFALLKRSEL